MKNRGIIAGIIAITMCMSGGAWGSFKITKPTPTDTDEQPSDFKVNSPTISPKPKAKPKPKVKPKIDNGETDICKN